MVAMPSFNRPVSVLHPICCAGTCHDSVGHACSSHHQEIGAASPTAGLRRMRERFCPDLAFLMPPCFFDRGPMRVPRCSSTLHGVQEACRASQSMSPTPSVFRRRVRSERLVGPAGRSGLPFALASDQSGDLAKAVRQRSLCGTEGTVGVPPLRSSPSSRAAALLPGSGG